MPTRPHPALALLLLTLPAAAQHLQGTVLDATTNKPIPHALVTSNDRRLATLTDSDGRFSLDLQSSTPAQSITLEARKPGYLDRNQAQVIPLTTTPAELRLFPAATLSGRILLSGPGELSGVSVQLLTRDADMNGRLSWIANETTHTNSRGEFHFGQLSPGTYLLRTLTSLGDNDLPPEHTSSVQLYPPTFLGDTSTLATAQPLTLHYGQSTAVELHLHQTLAYPVSIPIRSADPARNIQAEDSEPLPAWDLTYNTRRKTVEGFLPGGQYTFILADYTSDTRYAVVPLNISDTPSPIPPVTLTPTPEIPVHIRTQFSHPAPPGLVIPEQGVSPVRAQPLVWLIAGTTPQGSRTPNTIRPDELLFQNLAPGPSFITAYAAQRGYIAAITSGGTDLLHQPLLVPASGAAPSIDVILRDDSATVSGSVTGAVPSSLPPGTLLFLPLDSSAQFHRADLDADGTYTAEGIVPGAYRVLAFRGRRLTLAFRDPDTLARYQDKGVTATILPNQRLNLTVPLLDNDETEPDISMPRRIVD